MFDRVFICPHCGKSDGLQMLPGSTSSEFGPVLLVYCRKCESLVSRCLLSWELAHRFLRRGSFPLRTRHGMFIPSRWKPLPDFWSLGDSQRSAIRRQVTDVWDDAVIFIDDCYRNLVRPQDCIAMFDYLLATRNHIDRALTVRDFLSYCVSRSYDNCFG